MQVVVLAGCGGASDGANTTPKTIAPAAKIFGDSIMDSGTFGYKFTIQSADAANPFLIFPEIVDVASTTARFSTPVTPDGTHTTTRGCAQRF